MIDWVILAGAGYLAGVCNARINNIGGPGPNRDLYGPLLGVGLVLVFVYAHLLNWPYFVLLEWTRLRATPGKLALGIVVTDLAGKKILYARANGRYWSKILSGIPLGIGFLMAAFTARKQSLHDRIAKTLVARKNP